MFTCVLGRDISSTKTNLSEGANYVGGQLCGDKECLRAKQKTGTTTHPGPLHLGGGGGGGRGSMPLQWRNQFWQSLEEGAEKPQCSVCTCVCLARVRSPSFKHHASNAARKHGTTMDLTRLH